MRYFVYDAANNLLAEADENKVITRYYIHAQGLNQMIQGSDSYTYHFSATGHTLAMTDDQETVVNQYAYSPFGRILCDLEGQGLEQPFKYVGKYGVQHENDALYYMRARYYDAELGRFLKEDPIGFEGGLNVSLYVGGNPIVGVDPSGLREICGKNCVGVIGSAGGGYGAVGVEVGTVSLYDPEAGQVHNFNYIAGGGVSPLPASGYGAGEIVLVGPTTTDDLSGLGFSVNGIAAVGSTGVTGQVFGNFSDPYLGASYGPAAGLAAGGSVFVTYGTYEGSASVGTQCLGCKLRALKWIRRN